MTEKQSLEAAERPVETGGLRTVFFEETGEKRAVTGYCKRCKVDRDDWPSFVVSPTGMAHHSGDYGDTLCGRDATGPEWWWPL